MVPSSLLQNVLNDDNYNSAGSDLAMPTSRDDLHKQLEASQNPLSPHDDRQFATVALSPMVSGGSDTLRENNNITGMFSNSSDPNTTMMRSGMSRKRLLKDAIIETY